MAVVVKEMGVPAKTTWSTMEEESGKRGMRWERERGSDWGWEIEWSLVL